MNFDNKASVQTCVASSRTPLPRTSFNKIRTVVGATSTRRSLKMLICSAATILFVTLGASAQDADPAQGLLDAANNFSSHAESQPGAALQLRVYRQAESYLEQILAEYPESPIATRLVLGDPVEQRIRAGIRQANEKLATAEQTVNACFIDFDAMCIVEVVGVLNGMSLYEEITKATGHGVSGILHLAIEYKSDLSHQDNQFVQQIVQIGKTKLATPDFLELLRTLWSRRAAIDYLYLPNAIAKEVRLAGDNELLNAILKHENEKQPIYDLPLFGALRLLDLNIKADNFDRARKILPFAIQKQSGSYDDFVWGGGFYFMSRLGQEENALELMTGPMSIYGRTGILEIALGMAASGKIDKAMSLLESNQIELHEVWFKEGKNYRRSFIEYLSEYGRRDQARDLLEQSMIASREGQDCWDFYYLLDFISVATIFEEFDIAKDALTNVWAGRSRWQTGDISICSALPSGISAVFAEYGRAMAKIGDLANMENSFSLAFDNAMELDDVNARGQSLTRIAREMVLID